MAYKLFERLKKAAKVGAPEFFGPQDRGVSPQMQSNLDRQAAQVRFQGTRRMQGRPGIPYGPYSVGGAPPISPQAAASWVSGKLGTEYAPELNRLTAPDPMTFARGERAPEFIGQELGLGAAGVRTAEAGAREAELGLPFIPEERRLGITEKEQELAAAEAAEEQRTLLRPSEVTLAEQDVRRGEMEVSPTQIRYQEIAPQLELLKEQTERAYDDGDMSRVRELEQKQRDLISGFTGPRPTIIGGAPSLPGSISPRALERAVGRAEPIGAATGLTGEGGALAILAKIADETGGPGANTLNNLEAALSSIRNALAIASNTGASPTPRDILLTKIKNSQGYRAVKQRTGLFDVVRRGIIGGAPVPQFAAMGMLAGIRRPQDLGATRRVAQEIVNLVEGSPNIGGAPPFER